MKRKTNPVKPAEYWAKLVNEHRKSGLSVSKFSELRGISASTFAYHVTKYNNEWKAKPKKVKSGKPQSDFINLSSMETDFMELECKGVILTIPLNVDPALLRNIFGALKDES